MKRKLRKCTRRFDLRRVSVKSTCRSVCLQSIGGKRAKGSLLKGTEQVRHCFLPKAMKDGDSDHSWKTSAQLYAHFLELRTGHRHIGLILQRFHLAPVKVVSRRAWTRSVILKVKASLEVFEFIKAKFYRRKKPQLRRRGPSPTLKPRRC